MSISALHICILIFLPILLGKIDQAISDYRETIGEQPFSSIDADSHSDQGLDHSKKLRFTVINRPCVPLAVCLGSLSSWKVNLHPVLKSLADWNRFSSRFALYLA